MKTVDASAVRPSDLDVLDSAIERMSTSPLAEALAAFSESVRSGTDVILAQITEDMTPSKAATVLRMSRTHLYKLIKSGDLPAKKVGSDWRIAASDLHAFQQQRDVYSKSFAERVAHADRIRAAAEDQFDF